MGNDPLEPKGIASEQHVSAPTLRFRSGFAVQNVMASASFSYEASQIEAANQGQPLGPFWDEIRWKVTAAILMSSTALEANINEHLLDESCLPDFEPKARTTFIELLEPKPTLDKYQIVADLQAGRRFDEGAEPYQSAKVLIRFRNAIVHFVPEWTDDQTMHAKIGQMLQGRFQPSPYFRESEPLFPDRCISADCARWATTVALEFIQDFHRLCGTKTRFGETHLERISNLLPTGA